MSNPLIRPNDPRFQKPSIADAQGQNRFAEEAGLADRAAAAAEQAAGNQFSSATSEAVPYQPRFEATQSGRAGLLLALAVLGLTGTLFGALSILNVLQAGSIVPLIALVPAATAWLLGHADLNAIRAGAIDESHRPGTRLAYWLGLIALLGCIGMLATMIYRQLDFLPSIF
jgi:hypothetical protein